MAAGPERPVVRAEVLASYSGPHPLGMGYSIQSKDGLLFSISDRGGPLEITWSATGDEWSVTALEGLTGEWPDVLVGDPSDPMPFSHVSTSAGTWSHDGNGFVPVVDANGVSPAGQLLRLDGLVLVQSFGDDGPNLFQVEGTTAESLPRPPTGVRWIKSDGSRLVAHSDSSEGPATIWGSPDGVEWSELVSLSPTDLGLDSADMLWVNSFDGTIVAEASFDDRTRHFVRGGDGWVEVDVPDAGPEWPLGLVWAGDRWLAIGVVDDTAPDAGMKHVAYASNDLLSWSEVDLSVLGINPEPGGTGEGSGGFIIPHDGRLGVFVTERAGQLDLGVLALP